MGLTANIASSLASAGYLVVFFVALAESGLVVGLFLPGDTMLIAIGVLAAQGLLDLDTMIFAAFAGAVVGDSIGFALGRRFGAKIFSREKSLFLTPDQIERSKKFYERHGGKTVILARFLPVIRALAPIFAGIGKMPYATFFAFNVVGAFLWAVGMSLAGYFVGEHIAGIHNYIVIAIIVIAIITVFPFLVQLFLDKDRRAKIGLMLKKLLNPARQKRD